MVYFNPRWPIVYHFFPARSITNVRRKRKNEIEILPKNEFWSLRPAFDKNDETNKSCKERFPEKCEYIITKNVLKSNLESDPKPCVIYFVKNSFPAPFLILSKVSTIDLMRRVQH